MPSLACFGSSCHAAFFCSYRNFQKQCLSARRFDTQRPSFLLPLLRFSVSSIRTDAAVSSCLARKPGFRHEIPFSAATEPGNCAILEPALLFRRKIVAEETNKVVIVTGGSSGIGRSAKAIPDPLQTGTVPAQESGQRLPPPMR